MICFLLFVLEVLVLWLLSRAVNIRFFKLLPTPIYILLFLPGTFLHELSHFLVAKILFVPVGKFSLKPQKLEKEIVLGSVAIARTNIVKRLLIGVAPVFTGLFIILAAAYVAVTRNMASEPTTVALFIYFVFVVANTMFSSKTDLVGAWKVVLFGVLAAILFYLLGVRVYLNINAEVFKFASLYLFPAIAIDSGILIALSLSRATVR